MAAVEDLYGFKFEYCLDDPSREPWIQNLYFKDTETLHKGDLVNLESGEVDLAATNDAALLGIALETKAGTDSTTQIECIVDPLAVYSVYDANARNMGATLDISGTTGQMTVGASSNIDLIVVAPSSATERTFVKIAHGEHLFN